MQRLVGLLRRVQERPPSDSASAPCAAAASELQEKGRSGLHSAAASGDLARLQRRWWWKRLCINRRDANKQTPLHLACVNGHADVVRFLAEKKCQLNPRDNFNKSPLMKAVECQHKDCVAILLKHGANPDLKGSGGNTALHLAALIPSKSLVELLLEHNTDIDAKNELGYTPLSLVIMEHCGEMAEFLLQKGANVHAQDRHKRTNLMLAAVTGDMNLIRLLLRHGADLSQEDCFGHTAMYYASLNRYADIENELEEYMGCERTDECFAEGPAVLASSCPGTAADSPLGAPALTGAGVLPAAGAEQEDDFNSSSENKVLSLPETDSEGPREVLANVLIPAADRHRVHAQPVAEERGNGVLPTAAGAEQEEDDDSPFDSETDLEDSRKALADVLLPAADRHRVRAQPVAEERGNGVLPTAAGAEQEEDFDSSSENEGWVRQLVQELVDALQKKSLAEASLEATKRYSRHLQEEKLQLQKELDRSKAELQELKERHIRTEYYAKSLKNAIKERELTSRNLCGLLVASSGTAAILELEEHMQRLRVGKARLEARVQQQAKTIEALQKDLQASISAHNGLEDLITGFQTTRTAKEHQHRQCGSESKEAKKLVEMKYRSEALLGKMRAKKHRTEGRTYQVEDASGGISDKADGIRGEKERVPAQFPGEMKNSCYEVANEVGKLRRKVTSGLFDGFEVTNVVSMAPHLTDFHRIAAEPPTRLSNEKMLKRRKCQKTECSQEDE